MPKAKDEERTPGLKADLETVYHPISREEVEAANRERDDFIRQQPPSVQHYINQQTAYIKQRDAYICQQDADIQTLKDEVNRLENALKTQDQAIRELDKLKAAFEKLQVDALSSVDRYQPATDEVIKSRLGGIELKVTPLGNLLFKMNTKLSPLEWQECVISAMHPHSFNAEAGILDFQNKEIRKKVLKNVVWHFLDSRIFDRPFAGFGGTPADELNRNYSILYPKPHADETSATWRTLTAQKLTKIRRKEDEKRLVENLKMEFEGVVEGLGYDSQNAEFQRKCGATLLKAADFAQVLSEQRAIFKFFFPSLKHGHVSKMEDDNSMTNVDGDSDETERAGDVWFVTKPGLAKWGTGIGKKLDSPMTIVKSYVELVRKTDDCEILDHRDMGTAVRAVTSHH